jgi:hypothetical protein
MKSLKFAIILLALAAAPGAVSVAVAADAETGLVTIKALGTVNGQALACSEVQVAARAKSMMLAHAPKTALYGTAYEEATQAAYLAQTRSASSCPESISLLAQLNQLALQLAAELPVVAPSSK